MINQAINALCDHYEKLGLLSPMDREYARNRAFSLMKVEPEAYQPASISRSDALKILLIAAERRGIISAEGVAFKDDFIAKLTDLFLPRPGEYQSIVDSLLNNNPETATDWMHQVALETEYIKQERIEKNIYHHYQTETGEVEVTINVSKPEKSPEEIRLAKTAVIGYPACLLCKENVGLSDVPHPPRTHHRILGLTLNGENYFFQYSPYAYFNEHCIVFSKDHVPMKIDGRVVDRFLDFVDLFPHYFLAANADLPIVGGSILTHDHYQGGRAEFPVDRAKTIRLFESDELNVDKLDWPISAVRVSGSKTAVAEAAKRLITAWRSYSNPELDILAETTEQHNTINVLARKKDNYQITLLFRNNRTSDEFPDGIFHTKPIWQVVKRENIGIIEAIGLAILPARLVTEMERFQSLPEYTKWLNVVPKTAPLDQLGYTFSQILHDCGVFKSDEKSQQAFDEFLQVAYAD